MVFNFDTLNARGLTEPSKCAHLLGELFNLIVNVAAVQETHLTCAADSRVMVDDYVVFSAYVSRSSIGVFC